MSDAKSVNVSLDSHFVLSKDQSRKSETEITEMKNVTYSNVIGSVMYLMISTRPDITYALSYLSRFMSNPCIKMVSYVDSNYANDRDNRNWKSQLQPIVALSTAKSEYVVVTEAFKEAI
ncbi:secreted RxLR effector protein 161-like [Impatiens glandulifera]|uniref:secreted RxLR effector protein 161-like n=1 Tax=Impatiens glandulifera TaxID=253017 RepID=UPI001FB0579E|nr:secreted RxLR effector protein 161-like [Impatiens glandulifera]